MIQSMDFAFSEEQEELRRYVRNWLGERASTARTRSIMAGDDGFDRDDWRSMAGMGWQAMAIPEKYDGAGFGVMELFVLFEEQGRALLAAPFLPTVALAATAIAESETDELKAAWLPPIAAGEITATVVGLETPIGATREGKNWRLDGADRFVVNGHTADLLVVRASDGDEEFWLTVEGGSAVRARNQTLDETRPLAGVTFLAAMVPDSARLVGDGARITSRVRETGVVCLAAEQVGLAQRCLEMAVDYAKDRHQFGRPIGSFQAIKHKCADMALAVETARAAAMYAAWSLGSEESVRAVPLAKAVCSEAAMKCASENIQIHGGIGFTWEHDAHLFFKRAKSSEVMLGDPASHRRRLAELVL